MGYQRRVLRLQLHCKRGLQRVEEFCFSFTTGWHCKPDRTSFSRKSVQFRDKVVHKLGVRVQSLRPRKKCHTLKKIGRDHTIGSIFGELGTNEQQRLAVIFERQKRLQLCLHKIGYETGGGYANIHRGCLSEVSDRKARL